MNKMNDHDTNAFESKIVLKAKLARKSLKDIVKTIKSLDVNFYPLPKEGKARRIAALDGGGYSEDFIGITVMPARAAGAIFEQGKDPIWFEENDVEILTMEDDSRNYGALFRDLLEVKVALQLMEQKPEILFLDGSITNFAYKGIPHSLKYSLDDTSKIEEGSYIDKFLSLYQEFIQSAYKLITKCIEKEVILVGVSKDSRADILGKHLFAQRKKLPFNDVTLVNVIANGRAGFTKPIEFTPTISDLRKKIWKASEVFQEKKIQSFYLSYFILKEGGLPIRIDSLIPQKEFLKDIQKALVTYHDGSGFITPAYITHNRAHMKQDLGQRIINYIAEEVFEESPEIYRSFFTKRRRDVIQ